ncbi:cupin-like domain-containing protein [Blyttiomyces helicus]|uniref:Cupin-like domain-containing protein n=1 Tax=Blyttiomyces helicus TaxID=388810 RepID=A0A4P9WGQ9_9FUNG|nr:cupin-like domain-containing protein [Blyttiomyces helicus]|eukprot:RKO91894.1 cupin-like domain-containing protein [Blyttiomyces helicus]
MPSLRYAGFHPSPDWLPDAIPLDSPKATPKALFASHISTRTPCILLPPKTKSCQSSLPTPAASPWTLAALRAHAGSTPLKIERKSPAGSFGSGAPRTMMPLADFLDRLEAGETDLYLTTQYGGEEGVQEGPERAFLEYCQPPLAQLAGLFEHRPAVLGNLVPQQVNLWIGAVPPNSPHGTSSGLHHDFQDNLYVLLKGRKRFTLFSPRDAPHLHLHGTLTRVHPNGVPNYEGSGYVRSDGAPADDVAEWRVAEAERRLEEAERDGVGIAEAERAVEVAMGAALRDGTAGLRDDFEGSEFDDDFEDEEDEDEEDAPSWGTAKRKQAVGAVKSAKRARKGPEEDKELESKEPPSFSRIDVATLHSSNSPKAFSSLRKATKIVVDLHCGQMLYLPAGWFHEVTSYGDGSDGVHMAFNYWMAPPTRANFPNPYEDGFWESRWTIIKGWLDGLMGGEGTTRSDAIAIDDVEEEEGESAESAPGGNGLDKEIEGYTVQEMISNTLFAKDNDLDIALGIGDSTRSTKDRNDGRLKHSQSSTPPVPVGLGPLDLREDVRKCEPMCVVMKVRRAKPDGPFPDP